MRNQDLIEEAKAGNLAAVELLLRNFYQNVFVLIHWKTRDYHLAWDLTQETFIKMTRCIHTYDSSIGAFKPWLLRIAINTTNDYYRSKPFHEKEREKALDFEQSASGDLLDGILIHEQTRQLMSLVNHLPGPQRDALILKFMHGLKFKEIAVALNASESTIKSRVRLGLIKLKQELTEGKDDGHARSEKQSEENRHTI